MPENYYCLDNFFQKVTNMESPRKNNDCYFYYYSTCTKGDSCTFRHEPSALGCETVCSFWKEGKCINVRCNFRHMELRKNRKAIPCYWESQPGGCLKSHCPFLHQSQKHVSEGPGEASDIKTQELKKDNTMKGNEKNFETPVVDPLVVNFEEESDNESTPTFSPIKCQRAVKVKTLEEIKLEKIQAESAAYYSYQDGLNNKHVHDHDDDIKELPEADDLRKRILSRISTIQQTDTKTKQDFSILSLKDIRKRKIMEQAAKNNIEIKRQKVTYNNLNNNNNNNNSNKADNTDLSNVKIKTLSEIRAEKAQRLNDKRKAEEEEITSTNSEVTSTSLFDNNTEDVVAINKVQHVAKVQPTKRLKRNATDEIVNINERKPKLIRHNLVTDNINETLNDVKQNDDDNVKCDSVQVTEETTKLISDNDINRTVEEESSLIEEESDLIGENERQSLGENTTKSIGEDELRNLYGSVTEETNLNKERIGNGKDNVNNLNETKLDEVLLLEDEESEDNVTLKAEEDILKDIDDLLNE